MIPSSTSAEAHTLLNPTQDPAHLKVYEHALEVLRADVNERWLLGVPERGIAVAEVDASIVEVVHQYVNSILQNAEHQFSIALPQHLTTSIKAAHLKYCLGVLIENIRSLKAMTSTSWTIEPNLQIHDTIIQAMGAHMAENTLDTADGAKMSLVSEWISGGYWIEQMRSSLLHATPEEQMAAESGWHTICKAWFQHLPAAGFAEESSVRQQQYYGLISEILDIWLRENIAALHKLILIRLAQVDGVSLPQWREMIQQLDAEASLQEGGSWADEVHGIFERERSALSCFENLNDLELAASGWNRFVEHLRTFPEKTFFSHDMAERRSEYLGFACRIKKIWEHVKTEQPWGPRSLLLDERFSQMPDWCKTGWSDRIAALEQTLLPPQQLLNNLHSSLATDILLLARNHRRGVALSNLSLAFIDYVPDTDSVHAQGTVRLAMNHKVALGYTDQELEDEPMRLVFEHWAHSVENKRTMLERHFWRPIYAQDTCLALLESIQRHLRSADRSAVHALFEPILSQYRIAVSSTPSLLAWHEERSGLNELRLGLSAALRDHKADDALAVSQRFFENTGVRLVASRSPLGSLKARLADVSGRWQPLAQMVLQDLQLQREVATSIANRSEQCNTSPAMWAVCDELCALSAVADIRQFLAELAQIDLSDSGSSQHATIQQLCTLLHAYPDSHAAAAIKHLVEQLRQIDAESETVAQRFHAVLAEQLPDKELRGIFLSLTEIDSPTALQQWHHTVLESVEQALERWNHIVAQVATSDLANLIFEYDSETGAESVSETGIAIVATALYLGTLVSNDISVAPMLEWVNAQRFDLLLDMLPAAIREATEVSLSAERSRESEHIKRSLDIVKRYPKEYGSLDLELKTNIDIAQTVLQASPSVATLKQIPDELLVHAQIFEQCREIALKHLPKNAHLILKIPAGLFKDPEIFSLGLHAALKLIQGTHDIPSLAAALPARLMAEPVVVLALLERIQGASLDIPMAALQSPLVAMAAFIGESVDLARASSICRYLTLEEPIFFDKILAALREHPSLLHLLPEGFQVNEACLQATLAGYNTQLLEASNDSDLVEQIFNSISPGFPYYQEMARMAITLSPNIYPFLQNLRYEEDLAIAALESWDYDSLELFPDELWHNGNVLAKALTTQCQLAIAAIANQWRDIKAFEDAAWWQKMCEAENADIFFELPLEMQIAFGAHVPIVLQHLPEGFLDLPAELMNADNGLAALQAASCGPELALDIFAVFEEAVQIPTSIVQSAAKIIATGEEETWELFVSRAAPIHAESLIEFIAEDFTGLIFTHLPEAWRSEERLLLQAIQACPEQLRLIPEEQHAKVVETLGEHHLYYQFLRESLQLDRSLVKTMLRHQPLSFSMLPDTLQQDPALLKLVLESYLELTDSLSNACMDDPRGAKGLFLKALQKVQAQENGATAFLKMLFEKLFSQSLLCNKEFMLFCVQKSPEAICYIGEPLQQDMEFLVQTIRCAPLSALYVHASWPLFQQLGQEISATLLIMLQGGFREGSQHKSLAGKTLTRLAAEQVGCLPGELQNNEDLLWALAHHAAVHHESWDSLQPAMNARFKNTLFQMCLASGPQLAQGRAKHLPLQFIDQIERWRDESLES